MQKCPKIGAETGRGAETSEMFTVFLHQFWANSLEKGEQMGQRRANQWGSEGPTSGATTGEPVGTLKIGSKPIFSTGFLLGAKDGLGAILKILRDGKVVRCSVYSYATPYLLCCEPFVKRRAACKTHENGVCATRSR